MNEPDELAGDQQAQAPGPFSAKAWDIERRVSSGQPVLDADGYDWGPGLRAVTPAGAPYVPGPQPGGTARVVLSAGDPYADDDTATFALYETHPVIPRVREVFDIPREQYERWKAATAAWRAAQQEIRALIEAREDGR